jgi:hypothetical protein
MNVRRWIGRSVFLVLVLSTAVLPTVFRGTAAGAKDQGPRIPEVIRAGLNDYNFKGAEVAVKEWVKGSALEGSPEALSQVNILRQAESIYGGYLGYHVIQFHRLSRLSTVIYMTLNYDRGSMFARFLAYRAKEGWILQEVVLNTKPDAVFPQSFFTER